MGHDARFPQQGRDVEEEARAATAARRELGQDYEDGIAEAFVDRIGEKIDDRVDARLGRRDSGRARASGYLLRVRATLVVAGLSTAMGALMAIALWDSAYEGHGPLVAVVLLAVLTVNITYSLYRDLHVRGDDRLR